MTTDCEHKSGTVLFDNANYQIVQCDYGCGEILTYQKVGGILRLDIFSDCGEYWPETETILKNGELGCRCKDAPA